MAYLIIPSRRTRQPQGAVRLRYDGEFFNPASTNKAITRVATQHGVAAEFLASTTRDVTLNTSVNGLTAVTYLVRLYVRTASGSNHRGVIGTRSNTTDTGFVQLTQRWDGQWSAVVKCSSGDSETYTNTGGASSVGWHTLVLSVGADCRIYDNNNAVVTFSRSGASTFSGQQPLVIGSYYDNGSDRKLDAYIPGIVVLKNFAAPEALVRDVQGNFWGALFAPDPRRLYFDSGASGGGGDTSLIFSDSTQVQTTDAATLVTSSFLVVQEATQSHNSENVVLDASVSTDLIVADATQAHISENSILQVSINLVIDNSAQSQTSDNITLTSAHSLIIQECIQDQTSENITLDSGLILTVADCIQDHTAENITILASSLLLINDATQNQTSENLSFTLATDISVNDSVHSFSSESPDLTIPGSGTGATVEEIVDGIMAALLADTIPVNIKKINDVLVYGIGTDGNPWRESA